MTTPSGSYDVIILGSGIAGLAGALTAHELGLKSVVLEKRRSSAVAPSIPTGSSGSARTIWPAMPGSPTATMRYSPTCGFSVAARSTRLG